MRKKYGYSRDDICPFCDKKATTMNKFGLPVCLNHKETQMPLLRCICGEILDIQNGKFGAYFRCFSCGNISFKKALSMNPDAFKTNGNKKFKIKSKTKKSFNKNNKGLFRKSRSKKQFKPKEIIVTSDEVDFL